MARDDRSKAGDLPDEQNIDPGKTDAVEGAAAARTLRMASGMTQPPLHQRQTAELDDREDHHRPLQDVDEVERDVAEQLDHGAAAAQSSEEQRRQDDPDGMAPTQ